jgi:hypothetical protein
MSAGNVGVTLWYMDENGEECEDNFGYYGEAPNVGDLFTLTTPEDESRFTAAPDGDYFVKERRYHFPGRVWEILVLSVDAYTAPEQTSDDSKEE